MKKLILFAALMAMGLCAGSELTISKPVLYIENGSAYAVFNLKWLNSWNHAMNNDAVWLFNKLKMGNGETKHILTAQSGHHVVNTFQGQEANLAFKPAKDGVGMLIFPSSNFRGNIEVTLKVNLEVSSFTDIDTRNSSFDVFGIEMVMIPSGGFFLGSPDEIARGYGAFYSPKHNLKQLIKVESENAEFQISPKSNFYYEAPEGYEGDQKGQIPASYPKGVNAFHIMKYELLEGQYVDFLNNLSENQRKGRIIIHEQNYNGSIEYNNNNYLTKTPERPCSFLGWSDAMAYADWAGLRPMTEFEYTKAARGTIAPKAMDYPWGLAPKEHVQRLPNIDGKLTMLNGWDESHLSEETKKYFGASYYWVMDLSGSLWERVVTVGHEKGRSFKGTHGDGVLSEDGKATNDDWPLEGEEYGGIGFRGGGFYGYDREYHEFNPFSPVSFRPYGGWHGGMRSISYGTRFVKSMD